jgi:hypothetical protein
MNEVDARRERASVCVCFVCVCFVCVFVEHANTKEIYY